MSEEEIVRELETRYVLEIEQLKHQQASWMQIVQSNATQQVAEIQQKFREEMKQMQFEHTQEIMSIQRKGYIDLDVIEKKYAKEVNSLKKEVDDLRLKLEEKNKNAEMIINPLKEEIAKLRGELTEVTVNYHELKIAREQDLADLCALGAKYKDSFERQSSFQEEIASLTTLLDRRGEEIRRLVKNTVSQPSEPITTDISRETIHASDTEEIRSGSEYDSVLSDLDP